MGNRKTGVALDVRPAIRQRMGKPVEALSLFSPAKINLFLAITGRRADGYHNLVSVVAVLDFGDTLTFQATGVAGETALNSSDASLAVDESNLVIKAVKAFRLKTGWEGGVRISLTKNIPLGAGLGGGSSDATTTLLGLNRLAGDLLSDIEMQALAARLGSDCVLFLRKKPSVLTGRGETAQLLPSQAAERISGRELVLFKPHFGIATPWAYSQMIKSAPTSYINVEKAERRLTDWVDDAKAPAEALLYNNMESVAFAKYLALPALMTQLKQKGFNTLMSGSGSACFALLSPGQSVRELTTIVREAWGADTFIQKASIL